jgi:chemotaxis protein MotB
MEAMATISLLNNQMAALRNELGRLNEALNASEEREAELEAEVVNLGRRLNAALASEVARLAAYRSDFFGRLMEILGNRSGVSVVGDRFVFETDILFESGSADLSPDGMVSLQPIAAAINQLVTEIPTDLDWVIRVDGHTDRVPLGPSLPFESNWELSTARSLSVINYFESQGVPPQRLLAAGFGEHYPISNGRTAADYARNRRIELKLTDR